MCKDLACIWIWARSHLTSHYIWRPKATRHNLGSVLRRPSTRRNGVPFHTRVWHEGGAVLDNSHTRPKFGAWPHLMWECPKKDHQFRALSKQYVLRCPLPICVDCLGLLSVWSRHTVQKISEDQVGIEWVHVQAIQPPLSMYFVYYRDNAYIKVTTQWWQMGGRGHVYTLLRMLFPIYVHCDFVFDALSRMMQCIPYVSRNVLCIYLLTHLFPRHCMVNLSAD